MKVHMENLPDLSYVLPKPTDPTLDAIFMCINAWMRTGGKPSVEWLLVNDISRIISGELKP